MGMSIDLRKEELLNKINQLMHDAERAEAGVQFAKMMVKMQPNVRPHKDALARLSNKAARLRDEAATLQAQLLTQATES